MKPEIERETTEVLGRAVTFIDDKKGTPTSHEARISKRAGYDGRNGYASMDAEGYGATPEEALNNLRLVVADLVRTIADIGVKND